MFSRRGWTEQGRGCPEACQVYKGAHGVMAEYHGDTARRRGQGRASEQRPGQRGRVGHAETETGKGLQVAGGAGSGERDRVVTQHQCPPGWGLGSRRPRMSAAMPGEGGPCRPLQAERRPLPSSAVAVQQGTECPGRRIPSPGVTPAVSDGARFRPRLVWPPSAPARPFLLHTAPAQALRQGSKHWNSGSGSGICFCAQ